MNAHKMSLKAVLIVCALMTLMGVPLAYASLRPVAPVTTQTAAVAQAPTVPADRHEETLNVPTLNLTPKKPTSTWKAQFRSLQDAVERHVPSCSVESRVGGTIETCR